MGDLYLERRVQAQGKRLSKQEARAGGPTLGEFYSQFQGLPGLRGLWYPGSVDNTGALYDQSGQGRTLTYNGNPTLNLHNSLIPYWDYDGAGDWHSRADEAGLDIQGTETTIAAALRGLTWGGWFWVDTFANNRGLLTKGDGGTAAGSAYNLYLSTTGIKADIYNGATGYGVSSAALSTGTWIFAVSRFTPSAELALLTNGVKVVNTTSIPASLNNGGASAPLNIANLANSGSLYLDGRCALAFVCAALLPDALLAYLFNRSRPLFGV